MKSLIALITVLAVTIASAQNVGIMGQSYILCSPNDINSSYSLKLENAAVGDATAIELVQYQEGEWKIVASRIIISTIPLRLASSPGHFAEKYMGVGFDATRVRGTDPETKISTDKVELRIDLKEEKAKKMNFNCAPVQ